MIFRRRRDSATRRSVICDAEMEAAVARTIKMVNPPTFDTASGVAAQIDQLERDADDGVST